MKSMDVFLWTDRQPERAPRAVMQRGRCDEGQCAQFSISISNGAIGMTVRFESEQEFRKFLEQGEVVVHRARSA